MKLLSFEGYKMLSESTKTFEADLNKTLNENLGAALGSPVKYVKIRNNAKKYQQAKVQVALNNLDFEKKKQASKGEIDKKSMETLKAANNTKNQALKDTASGIAQRMKDLATTDGLKKVVTFATTKANLAAAETALKAADAEETKQLKVRIKKLQQTAADAQQDLKDYESSEKGDDTAQAQSLDNLGSKDKTNKDKTNKGKTGDGESATKTGDGESATKTGDSESATKTGDGESATKTGEGEGEATTRPESGKNSKDDMISRYQKLVDGTDDEEKKKKYQDKIDKLKNESEERFLDSEFLSLMESELAAFESEANAVYLNESVAAKFRRLSQNL